MKKRKSKISRLTKKKIFVFLIVLSVPFFIVACPMLLFVTNLSMVVPSAEIEIVEQYREISSVTGIEWADMIIYDTVRYENDFSLADPSDTAFEFISVDYEKRVEKERCVNRDKEGNCIETETYWETVEKKILRNKEQILRQLRKLGYEVENWTVIDAVSTLKSLNDGEEYIIGFIYKDIEDMLNNLTQEQIEWANTIISENIVYAMYGDVFDLPDHIAVVGDSFFTWPVPGLYTVTSPYGWRTHPTTKQRAFHYGVDISGTGAMGKPIISAADGEVIQVNRSNNAAGHNVRIRHLDEEGNEWQSRYCHMSQISVLVGQQVSQGDVIGAVGNTGRSTGPHLHFELKFEGQLLDPYRYIENKE